MNKQEICQFREIDVRQKIANWWCRLRNHPYQKREIEAYMFDEPNTIDMARLHCKWQCMHCGTISTKPISHNVAYVRDECGELVCRITLNLDK